jgi:hypothetical protein
MRKMTISVDAAFLLRLLRIDFPPLLLLPLVVLLVHVLLALASRLYRIDAQLLVSHQVPGDSIVLQLEELEISLQGNRRFLLQASH